VAPSAAVPADGTVGAAGGTGLRYTARTDATGTLVTGLDPATGSVVARTRLDGGYRFPVVAPRAPVEGVSFDGRVLLLAGTDPASSRFAVLDGRLNRQPLIITLPPGFDYDALSPDGSVLYLVEHLPPAGSEHYRVRAYDLATGRLAEGAIADKSAVREQMAGHPQARATSPDGGWVATLYQHTDGEAFIHLLDARNQYAICLDLPHGPATRWQLTYQGDRLQAQDAETGTRLAELEGAMVALP
jgi:hypothetical protein